MLPWLHAPRRPQPAAAERASGGRTPVDGTAPPTHMVVACVPSPASNGVRRFHDSSALRSVTTATFPTCTWHPPPVQRHVPRPRRRLRQMPSSRRRFSLPIPQRRRGGPPFPPRSVHPPPPSDTMAGPESFTMAPLTRSTSALSPTCMTTTLAPLR